MGDGGLDLSREATRTDIRILFQLILRRPMGDDVSSLEYIEHLFGRRLSIGQLIREFQNSREFRHRICEEEAKRAQKECCDDYSFMMPQFLSVSSTTPSRVRLIGSCMIEPWADILGSLYKETIFGFPHFGVETLSDP